LHDINRFSKRMGSTTPKVGLNQQQLIAREVAKQLSRSTKREEEIKMYISSNTDVNVAYPTAGVAPTLIDARATIAPGTTFQSRLGEHIRLKSYRWKASVWVPGTSTVGPCTVKVVVCKLRGNPQSIPSLQQINSLKFTNSAATSTGIYSSTKTTQLCPYNNELWEILHEENKKLGLASPINQTGLVNLAAVPNNDYSLSVDFDINLSGYLKKDISFDDTFSSNNIQVNDGLIILVMCLDYMEAVPVASVTTPRMDSVLVMEFTDA
jgi:hypothetical protein